MPGSIETPALLRGPRVTLRRWRPSDRPQLDAVLSDPVLRRWSSLPHDPDGWLAHQRQRFVSLAITEPGGSDLARGKMALGDFELEPPRGELSFWLVPAARGRGLASAAARVLATWAFGVLALEAIRLDIDADNEASRRVARAIGAQPTGERHAEVDRAGIPRPLEWFELRRLGAASPPP